MSREANGAGQGSGVPGVAEGTGVAQVEERRLRGDLLALHNSLAGGCSQTGIGLFSQITGDRSRGNGLRLCHRRFSWPLRKIRHRNGFQVLEKAGQRMVKSLSLDIIKSQGYGTWGHGLVVAWQC